jgi:hypothetical protein
MTSIIRSNEIIVASMAWNLDAIEQTQLRRQHRVDGVGRLKFYISTQVKVPVGAVWKLLPWNRGLPPTCSVEQVYLDDDVRIAKDTSGQYFVYARPV